MSRILRRGIFLSVSPPPHVGILHFENSVKIMLHEFFINIELILEVLLNCMNLQCELQMNFLGLSKIFLCLNI